MSAPLAPRCWSKRSPINTFTLPCPALYQNCQITQKLSNFRVQLLISYLPFVNSTIAQQSWCNKVCLAWYHFHLLTYHHYNRIEGDFTPKTLKLSNDSNIPPQKNSVSPLHFKLKSASFFISLWFINICCYYPKISIFWILVLIF